jgi:HEAT repeat protein
MLLAAVWSRPRPQEIGVPRELVLGFLERGGAELRLVGVGLLALVEPPPVDRLRTLALSDPDPRVRGSAVAGASWLVPRDPTLTEVLLRAAEDPVPAVRATAVHYLACHAPGDPDLGDRIVAATRDEEEGVRGVALSFLSEAGPPGWDLAFRLVMEGEHDPEFLGTLLPAATRTGRIGEILERRGTPELVTALFTDWYGEEEEEEALARSLSGRFEELLRLLQPEDEDYEWFFDLAVRAGDSAFLEKVILSPEREWRVRIQALSAYLEDPGTVDRGIAAARRLLRDPKSAARLRVRVVESLSWVPWQHEERWPAVKATLEAVAESDENRWVREAASEALAEAEELLGEGAEDD